MFLGISTNELTFISTAKLRYIEVEGTIITGSIYPRFEISEVDIQVTRFPTLQKWKGIHLYSDRMAPTVLDHRCLFESKTRLLKST